MHECRGALAKILWVEADIVLTVDEQHLVLCPECAAMTVEQVNDAYGKWQRGEPR